VKATSARASSNLALTSIQLTSERVAVHAHPFDDLRLRRGAIRLTLVDVLLLVHQGGADVRHYLL